MARTTFQVPVGRTVPAAPDAERDYNDTVPDFREAVCRGRVRNVVCRCRGGRTTKPPVFALAVVFAVAGLTAAAWGGAAADATAHATSTLSRP